MRRLDRSLAHAVQPTPEEAAKRQFPGDGDKQVRFVAYTKMRQDQLRAAKKGGGAKRGQAQDDYSTSAKFVTAGGGDKLTDWQKQREREVPRVHRSQSTVVRDCHCVLAHSQWFPLHRSLTR